MAVRRQHNWLGQQRVDVPHVRDVEAAVAGDFDDLAGKVLGSSKPIVVSGMTIAMGAAVGNFATQLTLNVASAILLHGTASEPGALFVVPGTQPAEVLSPSNTNVGGSFTPNSVNYIGIDLVRAVDNSTTDAVKFRSTTLKEFTQDVPLSRTLNYRILVSTSDFSLTPNVAPVAKVTLDVNGLVLDVTDCREMMFRLGSGGSVPNPLAVFSWPGGRTENPVTSSSTSDPFSGGDKSIASFIDFFHAVESRLWEVGGGEHWYSATADREVLFVRDPATVFATGDNFEWTGTNVHWKGISFDFGNSTAVKNTINAQTADSPGLTDLAVGQCIYVDVNRAVDNSALTGHKANLSTLGSPTVPGSRHIIAWRTSEGVFGLGQSPPVGSSASHATATNYGIVELWANTGTDAIVPAVDASGIISARGIARDTAGLLSIGLSANDTSITIGSLANTTALTLDSQLTVVNGPATASTFALGVYAGGAAATIGVGAEGHSDGIGVLGLCGQNFVGLGGISMFAGNGVVGLGDGITLSNVGPTFTNAGVVGWGFDAYAIMAIAQPNSNKEALLCWTDGSTAPLNLQPIGATPGVVNDGDIWINSVDDKLYWRAGGATHSVGP